MVQPRIRVKAKVPTIAPEWPAHVVQVPDCPCRDASPTIGLVYRRHDGTTEANKSYAELGKRVTKSKTCQSTALSCYVDLNYLRDLIQVHEDWADQHIVGAALEPQHGLIKQTGATDPNHYSLWLRKKYLDNIATLFKVIP